MTPLQVFFYEIIVKIFKFKKCFLTNETIVNI